MLRQNELKDEVKRITEAIRNVFYVEGDLAETDVESLHGQLVECVDAVNQRLRRCDELLRKGLRGEAIQESEIAPNLLDLVTDLDIPESDAWSDYVRQFSIPPQPDLLVDVAAALNEAYTETQPLDGLLRLHRLHALARSPLKNRVAILRAIATKDSTNPVWREDLTSYERNRLQQVDRELRQFQQESNIRALDELRRELADPSWLVPPSPKIVKQVMTTYEQLRIEAARSRLDSIEQEIVSAFSDFNVRRAELARDEWDKYAVVAKLTEEDEVFQRVLPAFDWLDQEASEEQRKLDFARVLASLESGLDNDSPTKTDLMRLFNEVERFDDTIPERVRRRYAERLRSLEAGETRRGRFVLLASFATLLLLGGITTFIIFWQMRSSQINSASEILAKLIANKQITEAQSYFERIKADTPFIVAAAPMQKLHAELTQSLRQEEGRVQRVRQHIDAASELAETESTWEKLRGALKELEDAEAIAKHEHEFVAIKTAEGDVLREQTRLQKEVDELFSSDLDKIVVELQRLDEIDRAQLRDLLSRAEQLQHRDRVSETARQGSRIGDIVKKLTDRDRSFEIFAKKLAAIKRVTDSIGSAPSYRLALDNYVANSVDAFQAGSRVRDFQKVGKDELDFIADVEKWNALARSWNRLSFTKPEELASVGSSVLKEVKSTHSDFPSAREAIAMSDYLDSVTKQFSSKPLVDQLKEMLTGPAFELRYVEVLKDNQKLYFVGKPKKDDSRTIVIDALMSVQDDNDVNERSFLKTHLRKFGEQRYSLAPHSLVAHQAIPS
ncbi:MAG: hypothetical protein HYV60_25310 [Planctomycetia bacterium]|nr:hypothetical protein [Planctomycetia bacterium]